MEKIIIIGVGTPKGDKKDIYKKFKDTYPDYGSFLYDIKIDEPSRSYAPSSFKKVKISPKYGSSSMIQMMVFDSTGRGPIPIDRIKSLIAYREKHELDGKRRSSKRRSSKRRSSKRRSSKRRSSKRTRRSSN